VIQWSGEFMRKKKDAMSSRRDFLRMVTAASVAVPSLITPAIADDQETSSSTKGEVRHGAGARGMRLSDFAETEIQFPRIFTGPKLSRISFPLGGIGTGGIGLGGRGNLLDLDIFNRPNKGVYPESGRGNFPEFAFPAIWVKTGENPPKGVSRRDKSAGHSRFVDTRRISRVTGNVILKRIHRQPHLPVRENAPLHE
jgi:hypothetical protein